METMENSPEQVKESKETRHKGKAFLPVGRVANGIAELPTVLFYKRRLTSKSFKRLDMWDLPSTITGKQDIKPNYSNKPPYTRTVRTVV